jgi:hypothetical protein
MILSVTEAVGLVASNDRMNNEFGRMWKEVVMAQFFMVSWHLAGETEENHKNLNEDSQLSGPRFEPRHPEYEVGVQTTKTRL